jgi:hypothetical protein
LYGVALPSVDEAPAAAGFMMLSNRPAATEATRATILIQDISHPPVSKWSFTGGLLIETQEVSDLVARRPSEIELTLRFAALSSESITVRRQII